MKIDEPNKIISYFKLEKKSLSIVAFTGIVYNIGMTAGPFFEGRLAQCLYDISEGNKKFIDMLLLALIYIIVIAVVQVSRAFKRFYVRRFANNTSKNMRHMLYNSIVNTPSLVMKKEHTGNIMTKAISDVDACVEGMRKFTTEIFDTGIVMIAYAVMLMCYDVRLAIMSCVFIPLAYIIATKCKGIVSKYNEKYKKNAGKLNQTTMDIVENATTYRVFGVDEIRSEIYEDSLDKYEKSAVMANVWESALQPIYYIISMFGAVIIIYFGSKNVNGTGYSAWDIGMFTTFFSCFTKLAVKSSKAAKLFNSVQKAQVSWKRIQPMFREYISKDVPDESIKVDSISFRNVGIHYDGFENIVDNISFTATKGQIIGITGAIASGKSAFGKIFIDEARYNGSIEFNGVEFSDIADCDKNKMITYMGHENELMSVSIAENIMMGREGKPIDEILSCVCFDEETARMENGVNTSVGNNGVKLSGGQQSRVALARCLYSDKNIQVLDDPFSALDRETEMKIYANIRSLSKDKIIFIVSHRLELFEKFDGVLFINNKTAVYDSHKKLMDTQPEYAKLCKMQGGDINA